MYPFYGLFYDPTIWLLIPAIILTLFAQMKINSIYGKYTRVQNSNLYTGYQVARNILDQNGLGDVQIEQSRGRLSDHYDPRTRVLRLSPEVYHGTSVASAGIAAHECGHAIQHATEYVPLQLRGTIAPVAAVASNISWLLIFLGLVMGATKLLDIGIIVFTVVVAFQLVTLPVEFNASGRAIHILETNGLVPQSEIGGVKKVLSAAALTYIAAALSAILQLLRLVLISNRRNSN